MRRSRAAGAATAPPAPGIRVLQSVPEPHERQNPYLSLLARALPTEDDVLWFRWRTALFGRYDVVHAHWPELALRGATSLRRAGQRVLFSMWVARLRVAHIPVVRTVHNVAPHEAGSTLEQRQLKWFDAQTVTRIHLNDATPVQPGRTVTIPHGHFIDWFADYEVPPSVPERLLYFGLIRPYKGVSELLAAFSDLDRSATSLRIVGSVQGEALRADIERAVAADPRITADLSYVNDPALAREIGAAQLVVLPFHRLLNSSTVLLALSLGRPVLLPAGPVQASLAAEVGREWVCSFEPPLRPEHLEAALSQTVGQARSQPDLSAREWAPIGAATHAEYVAAVQRHARRYSE